MIRCEHPVTEIEAEDPRLIGPCGRDAWVTCDDCGQPTCSRHTWFIDSVLLCRLCYHIRTNAHVDRGAVLE
jgi:formylmethanofuran dehydrogenase subunit E